MRGRWEIGRPHQIDARAREAEATTLASQAVSMGRVMTMSTTRGRIWSTGSDWTEAKFRARISIAHSATWELREFCGVQNQSVIRAPSPCSTGPGRKPQKRHSLTKEETRVWKPLQLKIRLNPAVNFLQSQESSPSAEQYLLGCKPAHHTFNLAGRPSQGLA